ncbi:PLAC8 family protein [Aspergillus ellipticus CBS 707.79]|uniref:PLAC8 family protein n=1 Tax=Aspergillus ellipticus CBS 707.79 TaxID=1448320 RepID=A0A319DBG0_9EURO|nr:PLAC8 family protein [Aspergillus ellipticus CBS 707.79]
MSEQWRNSFWAFPSCDLCCQSCFCPCIVFGRTYERNNGNFEAGSCNVPCLGHAVACSLGLHAVCLCLERRNIRRQYNIEGGICGDFWGSLCCMGNVLMQAETESISRTTQPVTAQPYQTPGGMAYPNYAPQ